MSLLDDTLGAIAAPESTHDAAIAAHLDDLTKPPGSLGRLEELAAWYCRVHGTADAPPPVRGRICTFAGDHGVAARGVSAFPQAVTGQMVRNMLAGGAAINVLAACVDAEVRVIDVGVAADLDDAPEQLVRARVAAGTADCSRGPAMSLEQARAALEVGIGQALAAAEAGVTLLGTGEMGIANTTPSAAVLACLLPAPVAEVTGRGTGIDDAGLRSKVAVIEEALAVNRPDPADPLEVGAKVGGLEIVAIAGLVLGAAARRIPVLVDGFISSAGALLATRLAPAAEDYLVYSHRSAEAGHAAFCTRGAVRPLLDLDLRLGEGTGAALAMHLVRAARAVYTGMATFSAAGVGTG